MPAKSVAQQRYMGMVHAIQKGELDPQDASPDIRKTAKTIKKKDAKDFAKTKHKGLPYKVKETVKESLRPIIREILIESVIEEQNALVRAKQVIQNMFKRNQGKLGSDEYKDLFSRGSLKTHGVIAMKFAWNEFLKNNKIRKQGNTWIWN